MNDHINLSHLIQKSARSKDCLTVRQLALLLLICQDQFQASIVDYANYLNTSRSIACRALDKLERMKLVKRTRNPSDHRSVIVYSTPKGDSYVQNLINA